jgi:hypothetical protein
MQGHRKHQRERVKRKMLRHLMLSADICPYFIESVSQAEAEFELVELKPVSHARSVLN